MKGTTRTHALAFSSAMSLSIALAAPAWAQPATNPPASQATSPSATSNDQEIIVTARRTAERLQDVPISITVLNQDALTKRNIVSTADLGSYVPSLSSNQQFGPEKSSFVIRGFTQEGKTSPSVGVYFADVIAPRSFGGTRSKLARPSTWPRLSEMRVRVSERLAHVTTGAPPGRSRRTPPTFQGISPCPALSAKRMEGPARR